MSNVRHCTCLICSVPRHYEQYGHVAMYISGLTALLGVNILQQSKSNLHVTQTTEHFATKQRRPDNQDSQFLEADSHTINTAPSRDISL